MEATDFIKSKDKDEDMDSEKPHKTRARSKSLFEAERPKLTETDRGVFVMSHADFPQKSRSTSMPTDPERLNRRPLILNQGKIKKIIHDVFETALSGKTYDNKDCNSIVRQLATKIKDKVSELPLPHYKLACICLITKRNLPAPVIESVCAWDSHMASDERDSLVEFLYKNEEMYALGTVYGVYDEKFEKSSSKSNNSLGRPSPIPE